MTFKGNLVLVIIFVLLTGCITKNTTTKSEQHFTKQIEIKYAQRFSLAEKDGYKILTVRNPWQGAVDIDQSYFLIPEGLPAVPVSDTNTIIRVPVKKIICMSTTHISMISAINERETIKGVSGTDFVFDSEVLKLVENHKILDVGYDDNLNKEQIVKISPDLVMVYGVGSESVNYTGKLKELGIKVLFNADYLETDPLGKAEWVKVLGALFCREKEADSIFTSISEEYNNLTSFITKNIHTRPTVFLGLPWKDTWFISPDNSNISRLISDAGGDYIWRDVKSDYAMPMGIENVYLRALKAEYWLNISSVSSREEIVTIDNRLKELPSFKNGNMYNNNKRITNKGGNDYWESGSLRPQIILRDIASILHPDLFPGYQLYYYKKIE
jgi:iron complex transport system substrate-binding protein